MVPLERFPLIMIRMILILLARMPACCRYWSSAFHFLSYNMRGHFSSVFYNIFNYFTFLSNICCLGLSLVSAVCLGRLRAVSGVLRAGLTICRLPAILYLQFLLVSVRKGVWNLNSRRRPPQFSFYFQVLRNPQTAHIRAHFSFFLTKEVFYAKHI